MSSLIEIADAEAIIAIPVLSKESISPASPLIDEENNAIIGERLDS